MRIYAFRERPLVSLTQFVCSGTAKQILNSDQGAEVDEGMHIPTHIVGRTDACNLQRSANTCSSTTRSCARARQTTRRRPRCSRTSAHAGRSPPSSSRRTPCVIPSPPFVSDASMYVDRMTQEEFKPKKRKVAGKAASEGAPPKKVPSRGKAAAKGVGEEGGGSTPEARREATPKGL